MKLQEWFDNQEKAGKRVFKAEFARRCGVTAPAVDKWLAGSIPSRENMIAVQGVTGGKVSPDDFYS